MFFFEYQSTEMSIELNLFSNDFKGIQVFVYIEKKNVIFEFTNSKPFKEKCI